MLDNIISESSETNKCFATRWIKKRICRGEDAREIDADCRAMGGGYTDALLDVVER